MDPTNPSVELATQDEVDEWIEKITKGDKKVWHKDYKLTVPELKKLCHSAAARAGDEKSLIEVEAPATLFGDTHGQFDTTYKLFANEMIDYNAMRFKDRRVVFIGDMVDRGTQSVRSLAFCFGLYVRHQKHIFITRGNHELPHINKKYGLYAELKRDWGDDAEELFELINVVFSFLPFTARVAKNILAMHGGISPELTSWKCLETIERRVPDVPNKGLLCDLLWSDPVHMVVLIKGVLEFVENIKRKISWVFGEGAVRNVLKWLDLDLIVRAHVVPDGMEQFCDRSMLTIFSAPDYEDRHNTGSVLKVEKSLVITAGFYKDESDKRPFSPDPEVTVHVGGEDDDDFEEKPVEKKPKQKGWGIFNKLKPSAVAIAGILCLLALSNYNTKPNSTANTPPYTLDHLSEMSLKLSRVVNGLYIGESARSGSLNRRQLVDEFFSFGPEISLDSLANANMSELAEDLNSIKMVVDEKCSGLEGCEFSKSVLDGMDAVSQLQDVVPILEKALKASEEKGINKISQINSLVQGIKNVFKNNAINTFEQKAQYVIDHESNRPADYTAEFFKVFSFMNSVSDLFKLLIDSDSLFAQFQGTSIDNMKSNLDLISPLKDISERVQQKRTAIEPLGSKLGVIENTYQEFTAALKSEKIQTISASLDLFLKMKHVSNSGKLLTSGFLYGFEDLKRVSADIQEGWLKALLNPNLNVTALNPSVSELDKINKEFSSLHSSFANVSLTNDAQLSTFKTVLTENVATVKELLDLATSYRTCVHFFDFTPLFDTNVSKSIETLRSAPQNLGSLKTSIEHFLGLRKSDLESVVNEVVKTFQDSKQLVAKIKETPEYLNQTVALFTEVDDELKKINYSSANSWLDKTDVGKVGESAKEFIEKSGIIPAIKCFQEKYPLTRLQELNQAAKKLSNLKTGDQTMDSLLKQATSISNLVVEWEKVKPTLSRTSKPKRAAGSDLKSISKDLGAISSTVKTMADAVRMESDLNNVIDGSKEIDWIIDGIQDQNKKDEMKKIWNSEAVNSLRNNLKSAKTMSAEVGKMKKIETIADFQAPFESAVNVQNCHVDFRELASSLSGSISDPKISASLENLKALDLSFSKMEKTKVGSVLNDLQSFFNSFFGIDASKRTQKLNQSCDNGVCTTEAPSALPLAIWEMIVIAIAGVALIVIGIVGIIYKKQIWKWLTSFCSGKPKKEDSVGYIAHKGKGIIELNLLGDGKKGGNSGNKSAASRKSEGRSKKNADIEAGHSKGSRSNGKGKKSVKSKAGNKDNNESDGALKILRPIGYDDEKTKEVVLKRFDDMGCEKNVGEDELKFRENNVTSTMNLNHSTPGILYNVEYISYILSARSFVPCPDEVPDRENIRRFKDMNHRPANVRYDTSKVIEICYSDEFLAEGKRRPKAENSTKTCTPSIKKTISTTTMKTITEEGSRRSTGGEDELMIAVSQLSQESDISQDEGDLDDSSKENTNDDEGNGEHDPLIQR